MSSIKTRMESLLAESNPQRVEDSIAHVADSVDVLLAQYGIQIEADTASDYVEGLTEVLQDFPELTEEVQALAEKRWAERGLLNRAFHRVFGTHHWQAEKQRRKGTMLRLKSKAAQSRLKLAKANAGIRKVRASGATAPSTPSFGASQKKVKRLSQPQAEA